MIGLRLLEATDSGQVTDSASIPNLPAGCAGGLPAMPNTGYPCWSSSPAGACRSRDGTRECCSPLSPYTGGGISVNGG